MAAHKGHKKTGGRKKGTPNKQTTDMRAAMVEAFDKAGGVAWLLTLSKDDPRTFAGLVGKIIPNEIKATVEGELVLNVVTNVPRADD
jgi:hypothetical protein